MQTTRVAEAQEVLEYLTSVLRGVSEAEVIVDGAPVKKHPDEKERLRAAELLGKRYSLFVERLETKSETSNPFTNLTPEEIRAYIQAREAERDG